MPSAHSNKGLDEDEEDINSPLPGSNSTEILRLKVEEEASDKVGVLESIQRESLRRTSSASARSASDLTDGADSERPPPYQELIDEKFTRVVIDAPVSNNRFKNKEDQAACKFVDKAMGLRRRYQSSLSIKDPVEDAIGYSSPPSSPIRKSFSKSSSSPPVLSLSRSGRSDDIATPGRAYRRRPEPFYDPFNCIIPPDVQTDYTVDVSDGVYRVFDSGVVGDNQSQHEAQAQESRLQQRRGEEKGGVRVPMVEVPSVSEFYKDLSSLSKVTNPGPVKSFAYKRLQVLEERFNLHVMLNAEVEQQAQKSVPHRDFYNVRKVDTHVHHSACMNQKHLLRFIKSKLKRDPNEIVIFRDGRFLTLAEVFESLHMTAYDLSVDTLDMHANNTFHRFDRFNLKYNPAGQSRLREIFIKTDNLLAGQYLAEITREVISDMEASKYQLAEWRVSIYGRKLSEWDKLARWFYVHRLAHPCIRWLIQVPRLYHIYKRLGQVKSFEDMIHNLFSPLFAVTLDPASNVQLHTFLLTVVGFDCVDDESNEPPDSFKATTPPPPAQWNGPTNPPYSYWMYYLYANLAALNKLRAERGLNTFEFRPHCGEAGDVDHLSACFLTANKINHGIQLRKAPGLQYLYYLMQIGIAMSPLSNNKLFLEYNRSPFQTYFARGLNVSLSTDDPLQLHVTKEPLMEEYSVASQVWKLSSVDMSEIARNSVLQSGLEYRFKRHFLGSEFHRAGSLGNDIRQTNVPNVRLQFRSEQLLHEMTLIRNMVNASMHVEK